MKKLHNSIYMRGWFGCHVNLSNRFMQDRGVQQGSMLASLFNLSINNLPSFFADKNYHFPILANKEVALLLFN